jgi:hypothetical protein
MAESQTSSIFDQVVAPKKYHWRAIALISYVGLLLFCVLLFGIGGIAMLLSDKVEKSTSLILIETVLALHMILSPLTGIIFRGKYGWLLWQSSCYSVLGVSFALIQGHSYFSATAMFLISIVAITIMHCKELLQFFKVSSPLQLQHLIALLVGLAVTAGLFYRVVV